MSLIRFSLVFVAWAAIGPAQVVAQAVPADPGADLKAIQASLNQIVVVMRQLVQQNERRDAVARMTERIAAAERRLAPVERELREFRQQHATAQSELVNLQKSSDGLKEMETMDTAGTAAAAFEGERSRLRKAATEQDALIARLAQQVASLDAEFTQGRDAIARMDLQLDRLLIQK